MNRKLQKGSFRDPSGFIFSENGKLYRQVNRCYKKHYDYLMSSGLYDVLNKKGLLISHTEINNLSSNYGDAYKVLEPLHIEYISYPYEWCFSQLKDAAIVTLKIQQLALAHGMTLKDASAYNIQFYQGNCLLIDTLSFEIYKDGEPWKAYRQFCQHFIAPLALMSHTDIHLNQLLRTNIDGIPLELASRLLPFRTIFSIGLLSHIHLHAKFQSTYGNLAAEDQKKKLSKKRPVSFKALKALLVGMESLVRRLNYKSLKSEWGDYYCNTNYEQTSMHAKEALVTNYLADLKSIPKCIHDIGANTGRFSRIAAKTGALIISHDIDIEAVEKNYQSVLSHNENNILPLLQNLTNPSPALGWSSVERESFIERIKSSGKAVDSNDSGIVIMALALIHHLVISNNVPISFVAKFFSQLGKTLIIEFVPKSDSQVKRLLATREDIFPDYTINGFETAFLEYFNVLEKDTVTKSDRTLYLLSRKE